MKKNVVILMLLFSINNNLHAQQKKADMLFEMPENSISRIFFIDLDKGDKMKIELNDIDDLYAVGNLDSILRIFIQDIEPLKDSLADELLSKRIDYVIDPSGKNKIRIRQFAPNGSSYIINQGLVAALKIEQDTVNLLLRASGGTDRIFKRNTPGFHYFRISFFVNNLSNLVAYMDGRLQNKILLLQKSANHKWVKGKDGALHIKEQPSISSTLWRGQVPGGDMLNIRLTSDIQNYKNYFVPSLSLGFGISTIRNSIKREFSLTGESHFTFEKNDQGKLQAFRSAFLTIGYSQHSTANGNPVNFAFPSLSLGYLVRQRGYVFDKNTFRLGFGKTSLFGNVIKIEPVIYFHDFFKGISPGIRLSL